MDDRLKAHARSFDKLDWESVPEGKQVHPYAETIVTETSTLHNVLKRYLSPMIVEVDLPYIKADDKMIMDGVFASYISRLTDEYTKIENMSPKVKETMLADATYITERLSQLSGVRAMDRGLLQAVEAREVSTPQELRNGTGNSRDEVIFDASQDENERGETR
jgi:hypothetical protein